MANIMITERCNLKCSYCFANEFVNKKNTDISEENFVKAVNFIMTDPNERVGLIGGEPTIHHNFGHLLELLINNHNVHDVMLFTNAVRIDEFIPQLMHPKFHILVNCNSPKDIGENQYKKMVENLDKCIYEYYMKEKMTLGINLYSKNMDYQYILDLLKRYDMKSLRISLTVPNCDSKRTTNSLEYFRENKDFVINFIKELDKIGVVPFYDCNVIPECVLADEDKTFIRKLLNKYNTNNNLTGEMSCCSPIVDILSDLRSVRCFGLSEYKKFNIEEFNNIFELKAAFSRIFDSYEFNTCSSRECSECESRYKMKCSGGCLAFKIADIIKMQKYSDKLVKDKCK